MYINNALRDEIGELNKSKGWHDEGKRSIAQHCILLHSEVSEIVEDYRSNHAINKVWYECILNGKTYQFDGKILHLEQGDILGKPCGIPSELADVVIRALDMAYEYDVDIKHSEIKRDKQVLRTYETVEEDLAALHLCIAHNIRTDVENLRTLIALCEVISEKHNINLEQQIRNKIEYNRTRPIKHGGKRL